MRISALDDIGSPDAPEGSRDWAMWAAKKMAFAVGNVETDVLLAKKCVDTLREREAWKILGYPTLDMLCSAMLKIDPQVIEAIENAENGTVAEAVAAAKAKPLNVNGAVGIGRPNSLDNVKPNKGGNSTDYTLRRLARDGLNELLDAIESGEMSINAAAIQAGFRKVKTPLEQLIHWWKQASADERGEFMEWIGIDQD